MSDRRQSSRDIAPLPGLAEALSRRRAIFSAVVLVAAPVAALPALASIAGLSGNDTRLVAIADELEAVLASCNAYPVEMTIGDGPEEHPDYYADIARYTPLEDEMASTPADSMVGVLAKARALQVPTCRDCASPELGNSLADDLVRFHAERRLS